MQNHLSIGRMNTQHEYDRMHSESGYGQKNNVLELSIGDEINGYKVLRLLGAGGMGQVFLVENMQIYKRYALKVLPRHLSKCKTFIEKFRIEARIMSDLSHPNIVDVKNINYDKIRDLYYIVMEFIEYTNGNSADLEYLLSDRRRLDGEDVFRVTRQLCSALNYAHNFNEQGIVHRDLKLANILIDCEGDAHVGDFGLARIMGIYNFESIGYQDTVADDRADIVERRNSSTFKPSNLRILTAAGSNSSTSLIGTYEYMSPEQQEGEEATVQSDIYSLGLIIYRILTGCKAKGRFKLPSEYGIDLQWDEIIDRSLKTDPADRFSSVSEIEKLLSNFKKNKEEKVNVSYSPRKSDFQKNKRVVKSELFERTPVGEFDILTSSELFKKAEEKYREKDYSKSFEYYQRAADKGNSQGMNNVGFMYQNGYGVTQNYSKAFYWFRKAIKAGNNSSLNQLGALFYHGQGVEQDYAEAFKLIKKSAEKGEVVAMNNLGQMYSEGAGVEQDYNKALMWLKKAADLGSDVGMYNIGNMYLEGKFGFFNITKGYEWKKKAIAQGEYIAKSTKFSEL